jgi:probable rRNA maturation factor
MPAFAITIDNRQSTTVDADWLMSSLRRMLAAEQVARADVHIVLVDDAEMQRLNREHLDHDWATDVISFNYADDPIATAADARWPRGAGLALDGELVISVETALRQAVQQGWSASAELLLYAVHGCLHLCGYDDRSDAERPLMRRRERELLALVGLRPSGLEGEPGA